MVTLNAPVPPLAVPCGWPYWAGTTVTIGPLVYTSEHAKVVALGTVHSHQDGVKKARLTGDPKDDLIRLKDAVDDRHDCVNPRVRTA